MLELLAGYDFTSNWVSIALGLCGIFIGLICIVLLNRVVKMLGDSKKEENAVEKSQAVNTAFPAIDNVIENRGEIIAAVSAAAAEELGTDISAIRILSFKRI